MSLPYNFFPQYLFSSTCRSPSYTAFFIPCSINLLNLLNCQDNIGHSVFFHPVPSILILLVHYAYIAITLFSRHLFIKTKIYLFISVFLQLNRTFSYELKIWSHVITFCSFCFILHSRWPHLSFTEYFVSLLTFFRRYKYTYLILHARRVTTCRICVGKPSIFLASRRKELWSIYYLYTLCIKLTSLHAIITIVSS